MVLSRGLQDPHYQDQSALLFWLTVTFPVTVFFFFLLFLLKKSSQLDDATSGSDLLSCPAPLLPFGLCCLKQVVEKEAEAAGFGRDVIMVVGEGWTHACKHPLLPAVAVEAI